jgi:hypothetical protein
MKQSGRTCSLILLLILLAAPLSSPADKEKLESGRYGLLTNGKLVAGSEHSWTLWRSPDGRFEIEDHFQGDSASRLARQIIGGLLGGDAKASPEFRDQAQNDILPTDLIAILDSNSQLVSLTVSGTIMNGQKRVGLKCEANAKGINCDGVEKNAKFRLTEPRPLFWWYSFPGLLRTWMTSVQNPSSVPAVQKVVILSFRSSSSAGIKTDLPAGTRQEWGEIPVLENADLSLANLGSDTIILSGKTFHAQKFTLEIKPETVTPYLMTLWTDAKGTILAVQENPKQPGEVIALLEYTNFSKH